MVWRSIPLFLSYWLLAAHFLRSDDLLITAILVVAPFTLLLKNKVVILMLQLGLVLGVLAVWLPTIYDIGSMRVSLGQPWLRMALILSAVSLFSLLSAWVITPISKLNKH
ncbi:hypothetical protein [Vibrio gallicus]|uniref:hypothetical protein n=1 Tax=Vibrio gallicus TaxID=190897 RepID=UPI0021C26CB4|nr:hypothetical protein [Vibrio gallicus]